MKSFHGHRLRHSGPARSPAPAHRRPWSHHLHDSPAYPTLGQRRAPSRPCAVRGPGPHQQRHCDHLLFDFNTRFLDAARLDLSLSYVSPHDAARQGLVTMRAYLDFQVEIARSLEDSNGAGAGPEGDGAGGGGGRRVREASVDLLRAALLIAMDQNVSQTLERVESVVAMVHRHLKPSFGPAEVVRCINSVLYDFYGFSGERQRFYHPDSASLARLMQYKTGGPTALGILYIAVAERVGLRVAAVSLPSHLLIRPLDLGSETEPVFIDPYNGGAMYDTAGVARLLHANLHLQPPEELAAAAAAGAAMRAAVRSLNSSYDGGCTAAGASLDEEDTVACSGRGSGGKGGEQEDYLDDEDLVPMYEPPSYGSGPSDPWFRPYLRPVGKLELLLRLLRNLREVLWVPLMRQQVTDEVRVSWQSQQALSVLRMMRVAEPHDEEHVVAEALCLAAMGRRVEGCDLLRGFLEEHPEALGAVRTLFSMEAECRALAQLAAFEKAQRDKEAAEAARQRTLRARLAGLNPKKAFNGRDPNAVNAVLNDPAFFSRMYGRLWDDNYWISAMLENQGSGGGGDDDDEEGGGGKGGKADGKKGGGAGGSKGGPGGGKASGGGSSKKA